MFSTARSLKLSHSKICRTKALSSGEKLRARYEVIRALADNSVNSCLDFGKLYANFNGKHTAHF